jgi:hypothetical protein
MFDTIGSMNPSNRSRDILVGVVVIILVILVAVFLIRRRQAANVLTNSSPLPTPVSQFQQNLQTNFGITVPPTAVKADMKDVSGGNQVGLTTEDKTTSNEHTYTVIANLEDPASGSFYEAWLVRGKPGDANYEPVSLGKLTVAKGGWLVNYTTAKDLSDHKTIWITLEKTNDQVPEKHILEGAF